MGSNRLYGPGPAPGAPGLLAANTQGGIAAVLPATQTISGSTTETVILNPSLQSATQALVLSIPPNSIIEGKPFEVVASGLLNNGTSSTVTLKVYSGTSLTPGSNTLLATSGAVTAFAGKANWQARLRLIYDTASGKLNGTFFFTVNAVVVAEAALSNVISGIANSATGLPIINFCLSVTFGTGGTQVITVKALDVNF